jgi:hypothetical protein
MEQVPHCNREVLLEAQLIYLSRHENENCFTEVLEEWRHIVSKHDNDAANRSLRKHTTRLMSVPASQDTLCAGTLFHPDFRHQASATAPTQAQRTSIRLLQLSRHSSLRLGRTWCWACWRPIDHYRQSTFCKYPLSTLDNRRLSNTRRTRREVQMLKIRIASCKGQL